MAHFGDSERFPAHVSLERQLRDHELYACSLDALWRAAAWPEGRDPSAWLFLVRDVVAEVSWYISALGPGYDLIGHVELSAVWGWPEDLEPRGDWQAGDTLAIPPVGALYALALGTRPGEPE